MNFFDRLKAQVNMNDGGKTFSNPQGQQQLKAALPMRAMAQSINRGPEMYDNPDFPTGGAPMPPNRRGGPGLQVAEPQLFGQQSIGDVRQPHPGMQPYMHPQEDDYLPADMLHNGNAPFPYSPQETQYGYKQQDGRGNLQVEPGQIRDLRKLLGY